MTDHCRILTALLSIARWQLVRVLEGRGRDWTAASTAGEKGGGGGEEVLSHEGDCLHCHSRQASQPSLAPSRRSANLSDAGKYPSIHGLTSGWEVYIDTRLRALDPIFSSLRTMGILETELKELQQCVPRVIADSTVEACVPAMVRVKIEKTKYKTITACFQFDDEYPKTRTLIELKSRYISSKLLDGLTKLSEEVADKHLGKPQVLHILRFVRNFIDENPLCCCSEEISNIKKKLIEGSDELKLRQKTSSVILKVKQGQYYLKYNLIVQENYPDQQIKIEEKECNYPPVFRRWFSAQSLEIARKCVEPPAKKKPKDPPFVLKPSMEPVVSFLIEEAHRYVEMKCKVCGKKAFPEDPKDNDPDEYAPMNVERVYCGHIYHHKCLDTYIKTPPFMKGKTCHTCGLKIYHEKWKLTPETVEARWAHKQAKQRELDEVVDFLS